MQLLQKERTHCQIVLQQNQKHAESTDTDKNSPTQKITKLDTEETPEYSLFYTQGQNTPALTLVTRKVNGTAKKLWNTKDSVTV